MSVYWWTVVWATLLTLSVALSTITLDTLTEFITEDFIPETTESTASHLFVWTTAWNQKNHLWEFTKTDEEPWITFPLTLKKLVSRSPTILKYSTIVKKKNGCGCLQRQRRMQRQKEKKKTWGCSVGCFSSEIGLEFNMKKKGLIKMFCWYAFMSECVMMRGPWWPGCCFWLIFCAPDVSNIWWLWGN